MEAWERSPDPPTSLPGPLAGPGQAAACEWEDNHDILVGGGRALEQVEGARLGSRRQ